MEDCDYCGESFEGEKAYVKHLRAEHMDELGPIDRRRVGADEDGGSGLSAGPVALALVIGATVAVVGYVVFIAGGSGASVGPAGSAHYHGPMQMVVLGEQVDFSRDEYQLRDDRFHFEGGDGSTWHAHATGVTLDYAMEALGFDVTRTSVTYQGTTYEDSDDRYNVTVTVGGEQVNPDQYVLQEGDRIRIVVEES